MSEEGRRSDKQIRKDLNQNAKEALLPTAGQKSLERIRVITEIIKAELLLDIREHLDSIDCPLHDKGF